MADNYAHQHNARNAMKIAGYVPRNLNSFIMGANGPDPLFCYQMYNPMRKYDLAGLGHTMHSEKTGLFLRNLFRFAQTDAQKDYCLGFLCHYSLDSTIHPFVNYITQLYGSPFNISAGHGYFESALDSKLCLAATGEAAADVDRYCPELDKATLNQITLLFKKAVDATYEDHRYPRYEYILAFKDFRFIKKFFYSPAKGKFPLAYLVEKALGFSDGFVMSHMQPCNREIPDFGFWKNEAANLHSVETLDNLLLRADYLAAECINTGLEYFKGVYTLGDLMEDIGNKSYDTGVVID
jgi:hypothetical protein